MKIPPNSYTFTKTIKQKLPLKLFENINDSELADKINAGEKWAYQELFERYAPRIYQFSYSFLKNKADAEELVQDVFMKIWEKRQSLDQSGNIKAFIFKVAVNSIYDFIRRKNLEHSFNAFIALNVETRDDSTWHQIIYEDMQKNLHNILQQLPHQQLQIFSLSKFDGLSNDEIAKKLNISKRTVENHLYRAVSFLKTHFKNESIVALLFFYMFCS